MVVEAAGAAMEERVGSPGEVARLVREAVFERGNINGLLEYCSQDPFTAALVGGAGVSGKSGASSAEQKYYVYDIAFTSITAIGLNLAAKGRTLDVGNQMVADNEVLVESFAPGYFPVKKLGTVYAKDIIVSASVSGRFLRRVKDTKTLIDFLRSNGRPVCIRFRRNPSCIGVDTLLSATPNRARDLFLSVLKQENSLTDSTPVRKLSPRKSSNVKEALRKTRSRLLNMGRSATLSDTEDESSEEESLSPGKGNPNAHDHSSFDDKRHWKEHVYLFAIEVEKLKAAFLKTTEIDSSSSSCPTLAHNIYSRFLAHSSVECVLATLAREEYRLISHPSDKVFTALKAFEHELSVAAKSCETEDEATVASTDTAKPDTDTESPAKSLTSSCEANSLAATISLSEADYEALLVEVLVPFQAIALSLLKTEVFPQFLQSVSAKALDTEGLDNTTSPHALEQPVIFSHYLPHEVWRTYRKAANALLLYLSAVEPKETRRRLALESWIILQYEPESHEIARAGSSAQELVGISPSSNLNSNFGELKQALEEVVFGHGLTTFLYSKLGEHLLEVYDKVCYEGKPSAFGAEIPRLSQIVSLCGGEERLVLHRTWTTTLCSANGDEDASEGASCAVAFVIRDDTEDEAQGFVEILGVQNYDKAGDEIESKQGVVPVHAEKFFVPGGREIRDHWKPFAFNFSIHNPVAAEIQGACAVTFTADKTSEASTRVGLCLLSESAQPTVPQKLRYLLSEFADSVIGFREFQWDPRKTYEADLKSLSAMNKAELEPERRVFSVEDMERLDLELIHECLTADNMLTVFEMCLLEQKVLFVSSHYSVLQRVMRGFKKLLEPLVWCHIFIPVLPRSMLDHLQCPTPFLIGINKQFAFKHDFPYSVLDVVIVDLDEDSVQLPDTSPVCFPIAERSSCVRRLKDILSSRFSVGDIIGVYSGKDTEIAGELPTAAIRKLFRDLIGLLVTNCDQFAPRVAHAAEKVVLFREADYIEHQRIHQLHWNDAFLRTQAFSKYLVSNLA